jgi:hypothetical protein
LPFYGLSQQEIQEFFEINDKIYKIKKVGLNNVDKKNFLLVKKTKVILLTLV